MRYHLTVLISLLVALFGSGAAHAEKRVALLVGNAQYTNTIALRNPANDVEDIAAMLRPLGFEVMVGKNLDQQSFAKQIDDFSRLLEGADVGLFYYAGHGLQLNDKNYLVSTNAKLESEFLVPTETIELDAIIRLMESRTAVNLVFLDACRNNPLAESLRRSLVAGRRAVTLGRGLAKVKSTGHDTLIAFSAAPGQEASDGDTRNSPFTASLLKHLPEPGLEVSVMLKLVASDVRQATRNAQRPQQLSDMTQAFYFAKADVAAVSAPAPATAPAEVANLNAAPVTAPLAAAPTPQTIVAPTPAPAPAPAAKSKAAPAAVAAPPPAQTAAPTDKTGELAAWQSARSLNRCEAVRGFLQLYPNGTFVDLAKFYEQRLCNLAPAAVANVTLPRAIEIIPAPIAAVTPTTPVVPVTLSRSEMSRSIQLELMRVGCSGTGALKANGEWDTASQGALRLFNRFGKQKLDVSNPSQDTIDALRKQDNRVCPLVCGDGFQVKGDVCVATPEPAPKAKKAAKSDPEPEPRRARRAPREDAEKSAPEGSRSKRARRAPSDDDGRAAQEAPRRVQRDQDGPPRRVQREPEGGPPPSGGGAPIGPGLLFGIGGGLLGLGR